MNESKQRRINLWTFPIGTIGRDMAYALFTNFFLTYIMFTRTLTAGQLSAITTIMVLARIFDALNDPFMGSVIEHTHTKYGKFKPWMVAGVIGSSLVIIAAFNSSLQGWHFIAFFAVIYFLFSIFFTMHDISYYGMIAALSSDSDDRNRLTSRSTLCAGLGVALSSLVIPMFTTGHLALGGNTATAYGRLSVLFCILMPLMLCFTIFGTRERREPNGRNTSPISPRRILATLLGNDQLRWVSGAFLLQQVGSCLAIMGIGSTYIYFDFGYNGSLYAIFNTIGLVACAALAIGYPSISRRIPRKAFMGKMILCIIVFYLAMIFCGLWVDNDTLRFWGVTLFYMLANAGQYSFYLIMMISIINTVEYNEYLHGVRDEAIISSLRPFLTKLASAIVVAMTSLTYILCGVTQTTNQISSFESAAGAGLITETEKLASINAAMENVSRSQTNGLLLCMTLLPLLLMLAAYLLYTRKYHLDETEYTRICAELQHRNCGDAHPVP